MNNAIKLAKQTIATQIEALQAMASRIDHSFQKAIDIVLDGRGRLVVVGMGKSGIIGQKIVATLASTGTPSFFVHPGEAFHGDLGMIKPIDTALMISNSGETEEVIRLLPFLQHQQNKVIAMTGKIDSTLAQNADVVLDISVMREACTNNLAPTSSTTATLVMGDALAIALSNARNFKPEDFAKFHPGGSLGRRLLSRVCDLMHKDNLPYCQPDTNFRDVVHIINKGRLGLALVVTEGKLLGIITDGDLRRAFDVEVDHRKLMAKNIMTETPITINANNRLLDAEELMIRHKINSLIATNSEGAAIGVIQIYALGK